MPHMPLSLSLSLSRMSVFVDVGMVQLLTMDEDDIGEAHSAADDAWHWPKPNRYN